MPTRQDSGKVGPPGDPSKLYFRIGEVASIVGVEPHVLRYWEREFRMIRPTKSTKGQRVYSRRDLENLLRVRDLLYKEGFTIAGAKKKLRNAGAEPEDHHSEEGVEPEEPGQHGERDGDSSESKMRQTLVDLRSEIEAFLADDW
ncbi:MerR family transcriptional regulator [Pendulispora brunnea]|uniref:MerR family transcriptional regulator n=1 Tax=Pendulispora brunnea TaxID=2905690 RepID=A0ABZ2KGT2_9BACT